MNGWKATIGINGFTMVFGLANHWYQWFCNGFWSGNNWYQWFFNGFEVWQPLDTMVFQWFSMVANHWSNDGMVMIHRSGLLMIVITFREKEAKLKKKVENVSTLMIPITFWFFFQENLIIDFIYYFIFPAFLWLWYLVICRFCVCYWSQGYIFIHFSFTKWLNPDAPS